MLVQQENAFRQNLSRRGEVTRVLVDTVETARRAGAGARLHARSFAEAPEIDPTVIVETPARGSWAPGEFLTVEITGSREYDLLARPTEHGESGA
jgi:tRNA A37 methylthiotransferase MiaB